MASTTTSRESARAALAARAQEQKRRIEEQQRADAKAVTDFFTVADKVTEWENRLGETTAAILDGGMTAGYLSELVGWPPAKLNQLAANHRAATQTDTDTAATAPAAGKPAEAALAEPVNVSDGGSTDGAADDAGSSAA